MDPYSTLGVTQDATAADIKTAFRQLALKYHPDRLASDASEAVRHDAVTRFKAITEAYEVLSDDVKRAAYRRPSHSSRKNTYGTASSGYGAAYGYGSDRHYDYQQGYARPTMWQRFSRQGKGRPLEVAIVAVMLGCTGFAAFGVEGLWKLRNKGKHFDDLQQRLHQADAGTVEYGGSSSSSDVQQPSSSSGSNMQSYVHAGCGRRVTPYKSRLPKDVNPAELPLSQLVEMEEQLEGSHHRPA